MIGQKTEAVEAFWQKCRSSFGIDADDYFVGTFAEPRFAPYHDTLLDLVDAGKKRATAHLAMDFVRNGIPRRTPGDYWMVVDGGNRPRYLIRITDVDERPFREVTQMFAAREGEGDSSLRYWREVHLDYFERQCKDWGIPWQDDYPVVCEGFELVATYPL
ncbi:MAG: ASCH domain-containing protein [Rhodospirillaceae bacterium]|nr:ASCH domain-containing protein [Rhodospirillaceae bacterium]